MQYREPDCLGCKLLKSMPKGIGGKATCTAYSSGIPKSIFFEGKKCSKKPTNAPKRKSVKKK